MATLPTPIRAALGLAATAVDEARKLPETIPQAVNTVPMIAVSTAMQASLRVQQRIATLAARGDEVLSRLQGTSAEPPSWATFDDAPPASQPDEGSARAAFDKIDYEHTGFAEGDDGGSRWGAVGVSDDSAAPPRASTQRGSARRGSTQPASTPRASTQRSTERKPRAKAANGRKPPVAAAKRTAAKATRSKKSTLAEDLAAEAAQIDE